MTDADRKTLLQFENIVSSINGASYKLPYWTNFRGSSLPFCPFDYLLCRLTDAVGRDQPSTIWANGEWKAMQGTALHSWQQRWLGIKGILYGNWECKSCKDGENNSAFVINNKLGPIVCPKCDDLLVYKEFEISDNRLNEIAKSDFEKEWFTGHCDGIIYLNGKYYIFEYKTTSNTQLVELVAPLWHHRLQGSSYFHNLNKKILDLTGKLIELSGILFLYADRTAPTKLFKPFLIQPLPLDQYEEQVNIFYKTKEMLKTGDFKDAFGICSSIDDALFCPWSALCLAPKGDGHILGILTAMHEEKRKRLPRA